MQTDRVPPEVDGYILRGQDLIYRVRGPARDKVWGIAHIFVLVACLIAGLVSAGITLVGERVNQLLSLDDPATCGIPDAGDGLAETLNVRSQRNIVRLTSWWLVGTVVGAGFIASLLVNLFVARPSFAMWAILSGQVLLPAVAGTALIPRAPGAALGFIGAAAILATILYVLRHRIKICGELLRMSAVCLRSNKGIAGCALLFQVLRGTTVALLAVAAALSYLLGQPVQFSNEVVDGQCVDSNHDPETCCMWEVPIQSLFHGALCALCAVWCLSLGGQLRMFTAAAAVRRWYFGDQTPRPVTESLKEGFSGAYGSLAFGAAVMALAQTVRQLAEAMARTGDRTSGLGQILRPVAECLNSITRSFTRFTTAFIGVSGIFDFVSAAHGAFSLLNSHLLSTVSVWWFPPVVLNLWALITSVGWGIAVYFLAPVGHIAVAAGVVAFAALSFLAGVLCDMIDSCFVCWVVDLDSESCHWPLVHDVMDKVPTAPDSLAYRPVAADTDAPYTRVPASL